VHVREVILRIPPRLLYEQKQDVSIEGVVRCYGLDDRPMSPRTGWDEIDEGVLQRRSA
jgi:hypothetical protein